MRDPPEEKWRTTRLTRTSRAWHLLWALLFSGFVLVLLVNTFSEVSQSFLGGLVYAILCGAAVNEINFVLRIGVRWNDEGIQQIGTVLPKRVQRWADLSGVEANMHKRATILTFKGFGRVKLFWGFEAHRDILDLAKGKLNDARTS